MAFLMNKNKETAKARVTVGIPKAMMFFEHGGLWENFFSSLGCRVVLSSNTNKRILDSGVKRCNNENCLPIKVLTGHALELMDGADYIFIPRYKSTDTLEFTCPKFCGLPDMIRLNIKNSAKILDIDIDLDKGTEKTDRSLKELAKAVGAGYDTAQKAFYEIVRPRLRPGMEAADIEPRFKKRPAIAVLGHPYVINDAFLSMNLKEKLSARDYGVVSPADLDRATKKRNAYPHFEFFYGVGFDILGSAFTFAQDPTVRGIVYLSTFSCGLDSILTEYIERHLKACGPLPYLKITLDEHTGEAGFDTRLEAFLDMIERAPAVKKA
jgi:predicted nucleotide-binding protein (sugar kinase/HSP70/actin superfamily)